MNKNNQAEKLVYTRPEAQETLGLSESMILRYLRSGELLGYQIGTHWRIGKDEVLRFAAEGPLRRVA